MSIQLHVLNSTEMMVEFTGMALCTTWFLRRIRNLSWFFCCVLSMSGEAVQLDLYGNNTVSVHCFDRFWVRAFVSSSLFHEENFIALNNTYLEQACVCERCENGWRETESGKKIERDFENWKKKQLEREREAKSHQIQMHLS